MKKRNSITLLLVFVMVMGMFTSCAKKPQAFALSATTLEMELYEESSLTANKDGEIKWVSSDPRTVQVVDGKLTSLKLGSATITATLGDENATCEVTIKPSTKNRALILSHDSVSIRLGEEVTVTATLKESGIAIDTKVSWSSNHEDIASVVDGKISGIKEGSAIVTATASYKGQFLSKDIEVSVIKFKKAVLAVPDTSDIAGKGTAIPLYDGDVTALGFGKDSTVYKWQTSGDGWADRIWDADISITEMVYDYFITELKFTTSAKTGPLFWSSNDPTTVKFGNDLFGEFGTYDYSTNRERVKLYDNSTGKEADVGYINLDKTYTLVVLYDTNWVPNSVGIFTPTTVYLSNPTFCSKSYAKKNFSNIQWPKEKIVEGIKFGQSSSDQSIHPIDKSFSSDAGFETFYKFDYMAEKWSSRLQVINDKINTEFNIGAGYSQYKYTGFKIAFSDVTTLDDVTTINIWRGHSAALFLNKDGTITAQGGVAIDLDDFKILKDGANVLGQPLQSGVVYDFCIKIYFENDAYGVGVSGATGGNFYISQPYFYEK